MEIKIVKTEKEYQEALRTVELLMDQSPNPDSAEGEKLQLMTALIRDYESKTFPVSLPDPVDAILFRMEQQGLKPRDLIPYIGSRSRVSEVLSRKRPLTLPMIRALQAGLDIPASALLNETDEISQSETILWNRFPVKEMLKRGYLDFIEKGRKSTEELLQEFFRPIGSPAHVVAMLRKSQYIRSSHPMNKYALIAWSTQIINLAKQEKYPKYNTDMLNLVFLQNLVKLSSHENGPILAQQELKKIGVALIIEPQLSQTYLDGAAIMTDIKLPKIGLTLRYDRVDNFWFNLMHELAHVMLHFNKGINLFYDDLDRPDLSSVQEQEADNLANEALIPTAAWNNSPAKLLLTPDAAEDLANELSIHPAIIIGRMRHQGKRYRYLSKLTGQGQIRRQFISDRSKYV